MSTLSSNIRIAQRVQQLGRDECIRRLQAFEAFPLDFPSDMLEGMSVERLRHLLMAALITAHKRLQR